MNQCLFLSAISTDKTFAVDPSDRKMNKIFFYPTFVVKKLNSLEMLGGLLNREF